MRASPLFLALLAFFVAAVPMDEGRTLQLEPGLIQEGPDPTPEEIARGRQVYELVCSACHTLDPPPDSAPPMRHVVMHLRRDLTTFEAFSEHVRTYVPAPDADRSRLPPMAIERFGLMAPLPLADDVLNSAAAYLWSLADSAGAMGPGMGRGMGPGMRGRMGRDTLSGG